MGVKHTVQLTREEAEEKLLRLVWRDKWTTFRSEAMTMSNRDLEEILVILNDADNEGEGFENYRIAE